jgi:soluble lytic murein transglycosylase-like protein
MKLTFLAGLAAALLSLTFSAPASAKSPYDSIIAKYARSYGVPVNLAHAVIRIESNYRPGIRGSAGEIGLMQVKLQTARGLGYRGSAKGLYNPDTNIRYGMAYLGGARKLGGKSVCGTILRYNAGHYAKRMNPTSAKYCAKVKAQMGS